MRRARERRVCTKHENASPWLALAPNLRSTRRRVLVQALITWLLFSGLVSSSLSGPAHAQERPTQTPRLYILQSDSTTLVLRLDLPAYTLQPTKVGERLYQSISIEGFGKLSEPGLPQLPQQSWLVAVPPQARVNLEVIPQRIREAPSHRILPAPHLIPPSDAATLLNGPNQLASASRYVEASSVYQTDAFYPSTIAWLAGSGRLRDQTFVQLVVSPVQYNPLTNLLRYTQSLKLKLTFEGSRLSARRRAESDVFEKILRRVLVNYESSRDWRSAPDTSQSASARVPVQDGPVYRITVDRDGIYQVSYADLQSAGLLVETLDPRTFRLLNQGREVAILVEGEADGRFDPDDVILFFGQKAGTRYTDTNVYWLTVGGAGGRRMAEFASVDGEAPVANSYTETLHLERNLIYQSRVPPVEGSDHWYWNAWRSLAPGCSGSPLVYTAPVSSLADGSFTAKLRAKVQGFTTDANVNPDHHLRLFLNRQFLLDMVWDGQAQSVAEASFPQSLLVEGENEVRVEAPGDTGASCEQGLVDWFEIEYARRFVAVGDQLRFRFAREGLQRFEVDGFTTNDLMVFDITEAAEPKRLTDPAILAGSAYRVRFQDRVDQVKEYWLAGRRTFLRPVNIEEDYPSRLRSPDNGADYLIITHRDFYDEVQPLAQHRAAQGFRTVVVDVQDIYDEFSDGLFSAEAIRDFLAYAYAHWQPPAPTYVVLVGDGTFDFKDYLGTGERNLIPPLLRLTSPFLGEAASDNRYVTVSGEDIIPDMLLGRLPVNTPDEARVVVDKILSYENNTGGEWTQRVMFVADNADNAGMFPWLSDLVADAHLPPDYQREKIYLQVTHATANSARQAIMSGVNQGRLIVNYVGHSGVQLWAHERLLEVSATRNDLNLLTNRHELPVVLSLSSVDGFFHFPALPAISEAFLRAEGKGAIAWWGGSGLGLSAGHNVMNVGFFDAVFRDGVREVGAAATLGKIRLYQETGGEQSFFGFLVDTFILFGDPALRLAAPKPSLR